MLQAHSLLWHYLWVAPNVFLLALVLFAWKRGLQKQFPIFVIFAAVTAIEQLAFYVADILPSVSPATWWQIFWVGLMIEAVLKFALIGEIFSQVFGLYSAIAKLGKLLTSGAGVILILVAAVAAAYTPKNSAYAIVSRVHILEQSVYMVECGLILFLFVFAAYFKLSWRRSPFGIALGLGISGCVHLATWTLMANGKFAHRYDTSLIFVNMAAYHVCVLLWFYYLFVPHKAAQESGALVPEHNLELWNRELERLLNQ